MLLPNVLFAAYSSGYFPMAEPDNGEIFWYSPDPRAIFPIYDLKIPKTIRQIFKRKVFSFTINRDFESVIKACAERLDCWISDEIIESFVNLHNLGLAHSVEAWKGDVLVGGLYGVSIKGAFFGESMFKRESNASKAAFFYLVEYLKERNFLLLDSQFINDFTKSLGAIEISREEYMRILKKALKNRTRFELNFCEI